MKSITKPLITTAIAVGTIANVVAPPVLAQDSFNPSGQWQCNLAVKDTSQYAGTAVEGSFADESIVYAYPNGTFEAQGTTYSTGAAGSVRQFVASGSWTMDESEYGTAIIFSGQKQGFATASAQFVAMGTFQNGDYFAMQANAENTFQESSCRRIG